MKKTNIIIMLADDMGYGDVGCFNRESLIPTPNMDKLASMGMRFEDAHSSSAVCTPSRYGLMTGRYCWRTKLEEEVFFGYEPPLIEKGRPTVASVLKQAGYNTACIGKWHLGLGFTAKEGESVDFDAPYPWPSLTERELEEKIDFNTPLTGGPTELGFDYFYGVSGCATCQPPYGFIHNDTFVVAPSIYREMPMPTSRPGMMAPEWSDKDVDVIFSGKAVEYIEQQKDNEKPFFLYLPTSTPHEPCVESVIPEFARGKSKAGPRGDMVWLFDWAVGQVVDVLERTGQLDDTLIFVTSDNGALPGDRTLRDDGDWDWHTYGHKSCGDYRGYKAHIWEGGHREPFIACWHGHIEANSVSRELLCFTDIIATLATLTGEKLDSNAAEDSLNMLPVFMGEKFDKPIRESIIHHSGLGVFSIREGEWKLVLESQSSGGWPPPTGEHPIKGSKGQLFHIADDPMERNDLFDERPDIVSKLTGILLEQRTSARTTPAM